MATITVFTPAFNRANSIGRTYESLCRQTCKDFKWIVVDDGSTDKTRELLQSWIAESKIPIEYYYKENGGMHTAHNLAYEHIDTELAVCIDSDDYMPDDAVEIIISKWRRDGREEYAGMIGLDVDLLGNVIGTKFPEGLYSCRVFDMKHKYGVVCDKKYVLRTKVIKRYLPYPVFEGERNLSVNYIYSLMSLDYEFLCSNDVYCIVEYQPDGLTTGIFNQYKKSPRGFMYTRNVYMSHLPYFRERFRNAIHYVSSAVFARDGHFLGKADKKMLVILAIPFGVVLNIYIRMKKTRKL